jgi:hypothetical protein
MMMSQGKKITSYKEISISEGKTINKIGVFRKATT